MKKLLLFPLTIIICAACFGQSKKDTASKKVIPIVQPKLTDSSTVAVILTWKEWQRIFDLLRMSAGASGADLTTTINYMQQKAQIIPKK